MVRWPSYWTNLAHARHLMGDLEADLEAARVFRRAARLEDAPADAQLNAEISAERAGERRVLARIPSPLAFDRGGRLGAEERVALGRGEVEVGRARLAEARLVGYRSRPWLHSSARREMAPTV